MARLYNDSLFLYNASNISYDGVVTFTRTAVGSGVGTESASRIRVPVRTATGLGTGTETADSNINPVRTATGSGTGTQSATRVRVPVRVATGSGVGGFDSTGLHIAPRTATGSGAGTSLNSILHKNLRTAYGAGGSTTSDTAVGLHIAPRNATGSGLGTETASRIRVPVRTATGSGASTQTATWTKSLIFRTPVEDRFPWDNYRNSEPAHRLFAKANQGYRARNIFRLTNGTYTNTDPLDPTLVQRTYYGGHEHSVTQEEKDELVSAGYIVT
jgi:hypothetical protein